MKNTLLVFICLFGIACTGLARQADSPDEAKSSKAGGGDKAFVAVCRVRSDAAGHRNAVMTKSTGSKMLDDYLVKTEQAIWGVPRNLDVSIPVECRIVEVATRYGKSKVTVVVPHPPYPAQARYLQEQGGGAVKASFGKNGRAISVEMMPSTGSKILDGNTVNYALAHWRSTGGENITITLQVEYRLVQRRPN